MGFVLRKKLDQLAVSASTKHPGGLFNHKVSHGLCFERKKLDQLAVSASTFTPGPVELEKEIWFEKKILKWDWVRFCSLTLTKSNPTHFKIFFSNQISFSSPNRE